MKKRILSIILSIVMLVGLLPTTALALASHSHCVCGGSVTVGGHTHENITSWVAWDGTDADANTADIQLPGTNVYLSNNVSLNDDIAITGAVNFCLNGYKIESSASVFSLVNGAALSICDCSANKTGELSGVVYLYSSSTVNLYSGTITSTSYGIHSNGSNSIVNVYDGVITAANNGIYNYGKNSVNIYGGTITTTGSSLDAVCNTDGTVTVSGGTINAGNEGICNYTGTVTISAGSISGQYGINNNQGTVTISDVATVSGTTSGILNSKTLIVSGGTVSGGSYGIQNYSVYNNADKMGIVELSGAPVITGTMADIYLVNNKVINISGALTYGAANAISVKMDSAGTFTTGWTAKMGDAAYSSYFTPAMGSYTVQKNNSGELKLAKPPATIPVTGVELSESSLILDVGDSETLTATVSPNNATNKAVTWGSNNESVATVADGVVSAVGEGTATITATTTDGGITATCTVTVNKIAITGMLEITTENEPVVGERFTIGSVTYTPGNYTISATSFSPSASDSPIQAGKVYTLSVTFKPYSGYFFGENIQATFNGKAVEITRLDIGGTIYLQIEHTYSFPAAVPNSVDILRNGAPADTASILLPGINENAATMDFTAKTLDQYGQEMTGQTVEWSITGTDTTGISVTGGELTVTKDTAEGDYTLTATCGEKSDSITIKVEKAKSVLTTVKIFDGGGAGNEITTIDRTIPDVGRTLYINSAAKGYDQYGELMTGLTFTWSNTNTDSEISLADGYVTIRSGAQEGSFTYTASCNGKSATVTVNLTKKIYTVTYTDNVANETVFADVSETVQSGGTAPAYPNGTPSRTGYTFDGWYTSTDGGATLSALAYDFDTPVTDNLTLYAKWTEKASVSINEAAQTYTWNGEAQAFAITGTELEDFTVEYFINSAWTDTAPSAVGTYDVKITRVEDDTYKAYEKIITGGLVINAATPTATEPTAKTGLVYDGNAKSLINAGTSEHGYWEYNLDGTSYSSDIPTGTDAKTYTVYCRFVPNTGYANIDPVELSVTIDPMAVDEPTVNDSYTYTGSEQTVALTGFDGSYMTITGGNKGTNAGGYEVVITLDSNHIWKDGFDGKVQWSIDKAEPTVTWPTGTAYVKDTSVTLTGGSAAGVGGENVDGRFTLDTIDLTSAGEKTVTITFTPTDTNYGGVVKMDYTVTVSKRTVESVAEQTAVENAVYGTEQDALSLPADVEITVSGNKKYTVPVTWSGYDKFNLNEQTLTGTLNLTDIAAEVQQPDPAITASIVVDLQEKNAATFNYENKTETYNGSSISHEISGTLEGVASISYSYVGTEYAASAVAPTNAGTYEVTATFTMQPGYAAVAPKTATLTISPKEVGLDWSELTGEELVYSGTAKALTATATGLADGDSCTVTVELVGDNINVGTFSYEATALSNQNYKLPVDVSSPEYTITPKTLTITADSHEVYVGSRQPELTYTVDGLVNGDALTTVPTLTTDANMYRVGAYTITASEAAAGNNYSVTYVNGTLTVKNYPYIPQPTYDVEIADDITGGEVSASKKLAYSGDTITITVAPNAGYELAKLTVTDSRNNVVAVTKISDSKYTFKMPGYDVEIDAVFAKIDTTCPRDWTCPMYGYTDLDRTLWYHDGIHYCIEHGLMVGTGTNIFEPNIATSRAMIVTILWRLEGSPIVNYAMSFEDVAADQWYTEAIRWAASEKIVEGYGNGCFGTNDAITREQMVTIMFRYAKYKGYDVSVGENTNILSYDDAFDVAEWAIPAMQWACGSGMIQGIADGNQMNLAPQGNATRAQAAAILQRFCENVAKEK